MHISSFLKMKVVITVPAYNEEKTLGRVLDEIKSAVRHDKSRDYSIIVVDDGSTDNTAEIAKKAGATVYSHPKNYGLAETFRTEIEKCLEHRADIIVHTDADGQYLASDILKLVKEVEAGNDLVLGSRFKGKIEEMNFVKRFGNKAFSRAVSQITKIKISDAQTGFRAFTSEVAKIPITSTHTYTQEQIIRAVKRKFRIKEIPIFFAKRKAGNSRLMKNPFDYAIKAGINLLRIYRDYEPLKFFGTLGFLIFLLGFIGGIYLLYLFFTTGIVGHLPTVMLDVLFLSVGLQFILFGFWADMNKKV